MLQIKVFNNSYFRFGITLISMFLLAYLFAGYFAFREIHKDLVSRVQNSAISDSSRLRDLYRNQGLQALVTSIDSQSKMQRADDSLVWLGQRDGTKLAGNTIWQPYKLQTGDYQGSQLFSGLDDMFYVEVENTLPGLLLIVAKSYEESDDIQDVVMGSFIGATLLVFFAAFSFSVFLARRAQERITNITSTLLKVSNGRLTERVEVKSGTDDLNLLAIKVNAALVQLQNTVEGIKEVSVNIAHDLRTPLNRLAIKAEQLSEHFQDFEPGKRLLRSMTEDIRYLTDTFDALLRIALIEAETNKTRFFPIDLNDLARALCDTYQAVAEENLQSLHIELPLNTALFISGDRALLMQLYANLIENAIRYSGRASSITIEAGIECQHPFMRIKDTGGGIPDEEMKKVVKRFYRVDKSRKSEGSGMGLSLVQAIAKFHSGKLLLEDNKPGLRATVKFKPDNITKNPQPLTSDEI